MSVEAKSVVIAVDGTSGSGKSSTCRGVAERLHLRYLDTGAMFRALTWWLLNEGIDIDDPEALQRESKNQHWSQARTHWTPASASTVLMSHRPSAGSR